MIQLFLVAKTIGGKLPNAADLYLDTHFKKMPGKEPQPVNKKVKDVMVMIF